MNLTIIVSFWKVYGSKVTGNTPCDVMKACPPRRYVGRVHHHRKPPKTCVVHLYSEHTFVFWTWFAVVIAVR